MLAELADLKTGFRSQRVNMGAQFLDALLVAGDEILPASGGQFRHAIEPARIELGTLVVFQEFVARDAVAFRQPHQPAFMADQPLVDVVKLLDQRIDARLVEAERLHLLDDVVLEFFDLRSCAGDNVSFLSLP